MLTALFFLFVLTALLTEAAPLITPRQTLTTLSKSQISAFKPFSFFASAGYCPPSKTLTWTCGANCDANPGFKPIASGGDGVSVQFWFVGFDPSLSTVIVSHQGTDFKKIIPGLIDADFVLKNLDSSLFPGLSSGIKVHSGFADEHAKTANKILSAVKTAVTKSGFKSITIVGHSLGAALATLNGVFLPLHIPNAKFKVIGYASPRVGNKAFADHVDANADLTRVNNKEDFVPILPGRFLDFVHPQGEKHIQDSNAWVDCPGQDNTDKKCTVGDVTNILKGKTADHHGPYDGVIMGC